MDPVFILLPIDRLQVEETITLQHQPRVGIVMDDGMVDDILPVGQPPCVDIVSLRQLGGLARSVVSQPCM